MTQQLQDVNTHIGIFPHIFSNSLHKSRQVTKNPNIRENPNFRSKRG